MDACAIDGCIPSGDFLVVLPGSPAEAASFVIPTRIMALGDSTTGTPSDTTSPSAPFGLKAASPKGKVNLSWSGSTDSGGSGLAGYIVWRSTSGASGPFSSVATVASTAFSDATVVARVSYWYRVTAVDRAGNQSQPSNVVSAQPK